MPVRLRLPGASHLIIRMEPCCPLSLRADGVKHADGHSSPENPVQSGVLGVRGSVVDIRPLLLCESLRAEGLVTAEGQFKPANPVARGFSVTVSETALNNFANIGCAGAGACCNLRADGLASASEPPAALMTRSTSKDLPPSAAALGTATGCTAPAGKVKGFRGGCWPPMPPGESLPAAMLARWGVPREEWAAAICTEQRIWSRPSG